MLAIAALLFLVVRKLSHQHRASKQRLSLEKQRLDTAVNNMTQGLLLFDATQHLVICNKRYLEMYGLSAEIVKPGCSFREVIAHRKDTGSFVGDIDQYLEVVLRDICAPQRHGHIDARRTLDPGRQRAGAGRRMAGDP